MHRFVLVITKFKRAMLTYGLKQLLGRYKASSRNYQRPPWIYTVLLEASVDFFPKPVRGTHVLVWTPQKLTAEQEAQFEKWSSDKNFVPDPQKDDKSTFDRIRDMFS